MRVEVNLDDVRMDVSRNEYKVLSDDGMFSVVDISDEGIEMLEHNNVYYEVL